MLRNRKGVTLLEIMTVVVMGAVVMAITVPSMKNAGRASSMSSAKSRVESSLAMARSVAIRNGVRSLLVRDGNSIKILADSVNSTGVVANEIVMVVPTIRFEGFALSSSSGETVDTLVYDSRGLATNLDASGIKFILTQTSGYGEGSSETVCITRLGLVLDRNCGLAMSPEKTYDYELPPTEEYPTVEDPTITDPTILDPSIIGPVIEPITTTTTTLTQ
jgi:prepilin-type N-terminal cleavage/methylation domain-containing protein